MTAILVVIKPDTECWVNTCVKSIKQLVRRYDEIIVVGDADLNIDEVDGATVKQVEIPGCIDRDYLISSYIAMNADKFTDSECISIILPNYLIYGRFDLEGTFVNGKPSILCDTYSSISRQSGDLSQFVQNWQSSTEKVLNIKSVSLEFARSMPITYPRFVFGELRGHLVDKFGVDDISEYLGAVENYELPEGFCFDVFNVLGAYLHENRNDSVNWVVMSKERRLAKFLPPVVGFFGSVLDEEDVMQEISIEANNRLNPPNMRRHLKSLQETD